MVRTWSWLLIVLPVACVGTPVPIPIPIQSKSLRLTETGGEVLVAGLTDAAKGAAKLRVQNQSTGESRLGPITLGGTFAAVLKGKVGDLLLLEALGPKEVVTGSLEVTVPGAKLKVPSAQLGLPDGQGLVEVSGTLVEGDTAVAALSSTGEVVSVQAGTGGTFSMKVSGVLAADPVYVFATNGQGDTSEHRVLMLSSQSMCVDGDFDNYGRKGTDLTVCGTGVADCNDEQAAVNPGQQQYFTTPIPGASPADDFDYDCDGTEEKEHASLADCAASWPTCDAHGWETNVPDCGQPGAWITCNQQKASCVLSPVQTRTQACR